MSGYNEFYLSDGLLPLPRAIFALPSIREKSLYNSVKYRVERDMPIPKSELRQLANFPHLVAEFIVSGWLSTGEIDICVESPTQRFDVLIESYGELAPVLECGLENDFESLERLIAYFRRGKVGSLYPEHYYLNQLKSDPTRYLRLSPSPPPPLLDALLKETIERKKHSPEHAYFALTLHAATTLESEELKALSKSDQHAFLAALLLKERGAHADVVHALLAGLSSPRWIFHALKRGLLEIDPEFKARLCKHPGWAVEWLVCNAAKIDEVETVYGLCKLEAENHPTLHDLDLWFNRWKIRRIRPSHTVLAAV